MNAEHSELGTFLRAAREGNQLTLRAVERDTGISNAYLSQLESGKIRQPSPVVLHKLSELYETSYAYAMELAGYPVPDSSHISESYTRLASRFGPISSQEEESLTEYLEFLRARRRG